MTDICNASKMELDLMPDRRVVITFRCNSKYEAAILFDEISEAAQSGFISFTFDIEKRTVVK